VKILGLSACSGYLKDIVAFALNAGMRKGEILGLSGKMLILI